MTKYSVRILFILLTCFQITAQESREYIGAIKLSDTAIITYKVKFDINYDQVEGYSITDFGGDHETKSKLRGSYNPNTRELSFNEYDIVYTKSDVIHDDFCFVHFEPTYFKPGKTKYFKGNFKGEFADGEACISGELFLNSAENVEKRMDKMTKKVNKSKRVPDSIKQKANDLKILEKLNMNILKKSQITSVFSKSKKVSLLIYDGGQEDGDVITVKVNGEVILRRHTITKDVKTIEVQLNSKKTVIEVIADGVGTITTNTAIVEIHDDVNEIRAMTNLDKNQSTQIHILKKQQ
jgi:hypothetical protein